MSGQIQTKFIFLFLVVLLGLSVRFVFNHWLHVHDKKIEQNLNKANKTQTSFTNVCLGIEQVAIRAKNLKPDQVHFVQSTSNSFCYCMNAQVEKSQVVFEHQSTQAMTQSYLGFLKTPRGQKVSDYCNQVAKYEAARKSGRAIASIAKPKPVKKSK